MRPWAGDAVLMTPVLMTPVLMTVVLMRQGANDAVLMTGRAAPR